MVLLRGLVSLRSGLCESSFFSRSLTADIRRVNQLIATLRSGKLDAVPQVGRGNELSQLDRSIEMLESEIRSKLGGDFLSKL